VCAWKKAKDLLKDMSTNRVDPNLTTYSMVIGIVWPNSTMLFRRKTTSFKGANPERLQLAVNVLGEILNKLEKQSRINLSQASDQDFWVRALYLSIDASNWAMADRVVALYERTTNQVQFTNVTSENDFFTAYLSQRIKDLSMEELTRLYKDLVPRVITPSNFIMEILMDRLKETMHWPLLRRIALDCINSGLDFRKAASRRYPDYRPMLLDVDLESLSALEQEAYQKLVLRIVDFAMEYANFEEELEGGRMSFKVKLTPNEVVLYTQLLAKAGFQRRAWELLGQLLNPSSTSGLTAFIESAEQCQEGDAPSVQRLFSLFDDAMADKNSQNATTCLKVMKEYVPRQMLRDFELRFVAQKMEDLMQMNNEERAAVREFIGENYC